VPGEGGGTAAAAQRVIIGTQHLLIIWVDGQRVCELRTGMLCTTYLSA